MNMYLLQRHRDLRTETTENKSRTIFITSEISLFALLIVGTTYFSLVFALPLTDVPQNLSQINLSSIEINK